MPRMQISSAHIHLIRPTIVMIFSRLVITIRRARRREFRLLTPDEVERVKALYSECFAAEGSLPSPDRSIRMRGIC